MCGILFMVDKNNKISKENFINALMKQNWRGPDNFGIKYYRMQIYSFKFR